MENSNVLEDVSIRSILATINASIQTQFLSTYQNVGIFNEILIDLNNKMNKTGCYFYFDLYSLFMCNCWTVKKNNAPNYVCLVTKNSAN